MANQVVKVKRETIAACMTCPLCNKLLRNATTISECLHTFCRKCIYRKISDDEVDYCPVCNIDLGCVPLEKLRPDHNLQDLRAKIFPFKRRKVQAPEVETSVVTPVRQKERSLSSLVVSAPKVSAQTPIAGRRNNVQRKTNGLRSSSFPTEKRIKKEHSDEDNMEDASSPETVNESKQNTGKNSSFPKPSHFNSNNEEENGAETQDGKLDLWQPLNCLVEVANKSKSYKAPSEVSDLKLESIDAPEKEPQSWRTKLKENKLKTNVEDDKNQTSTAPSELTPPKRLRRIRRRKAVEFGDSSISSQAVLDAHRVKHERRTCGVWLSLVASEDQEGNAPLPQIPSHYLRIKDGDVPVSFIQKYLMKKLDLASEAEVEIKCMGQPILPTLMLYNLVEMWIQTISTSERVAAPVGSSAKDFVMVLAYARKPPDSN